MTSAQQSSSVRVSNTNKTGVGMMKMKNMTVVAAIVAGLVMCGNRTSAAIIVRDFSSFVETGNLLTNPNTIEQKFSPNDPAAGDVTITYVSGSNAGQELYLSSEFPKYDTAGMRLSVDIGSTTATSIEGPGLAIASDPNMTTRKNLIWLQWQPFNTQISAGTFDNSGVFKASNYKQSTPPDTLYIEKASSGWTFGYITGGIETDLLTGVSAINGGTITADGTAVGLMSDMRGAGSTWTLTNLVVVPEPASFLLLLLGGFGLMFHRPRC